MTSTKWIAFLLTGVAVAIVVGVFTGTFVLNDGGFMPLIVSLMLAPFLFFDHGSNEHIYY